MNRWHLFHEIGHAIIGLIFEGYLIKIEKIILNKDDISKLNLNVSDLAYTHQKFVPVEQKIIDENEQLFAMINGLNLLAGIAGATYLCPIEKPKAKIVSSSNFNRILKTEGASGDFEFINDKKMIYSWYLFVKNQLDEYSAYEYHAFLMNILQITFLDDRIRVTSQKIYDLILENPNSNIEHDQLLKLFPIELQSEFRNNIIEKLKEMSE